ncbi:MAG: NAD-dependent malic enzyme [Deltaproteobacteria bacterium]
MLRYRIVPDDQGEDVYEIDSCGLEILHNPILNKGSAFPLEERRLFRIEGMLPPAVSTLEQQVERRYEGFSAKPSDLEKYIYLRSLQDRNETLFYALLLAHLEEMIPIVYTPTVGLACQRYSHIFRYTRGIFLSPDNIDRVDAIFRSLAYRNVEMIVATDSEGILGIGDQGVGGMGIPVGKLSLYVAGAGIRPANCLPVTIDVGTDNEERLADPLYLGIRKRRIRGEAYFDLIDRFAQAVKKHFPGAILQWEDFSKQNAFTLLDRYRKQLPSFNDDIQGTGAVVLAGILCALRITGGSLPAQRFAILGAGAGGIGVARQIRTALRARGLSEREATERILVVDSRGVVAEGRGGVDAYKVPFAQRAGFAEGWTRERPDKVTLLDVVRNARPTVLLGLSGTAGAFTGEILRTMAAQCERPVIFPLSNPTSKTEAPPEEIYRMTGGRAIVATGSPFPAVNHEGKEYLVGQGNNVYIFPGVGLAALLVGAKEITDGMFTAAAERLAGLVPAERLARNGLYPPIAQLREICREIAVAVSLRAMEEGIAAPVPEERLRESLERRMWKPRYARYRRKAPEGAAAG